MKPVRWTAAALVAAVVATSACREAAAPSATIVLKLAGDSQVGFPGDTLPLPITVRVADVVGAPQPGILVRFEGLNAIVGRDSARTDANGVASTSVIMGLVPFFAVGVKAYVGLSNVTFHMALENPCNYPTDLLLGATTSGTLTDRDCAMGDGTYVDAYRFTLDSTVRVRFTMSAAAPLDPFLFVRDTTGWTLATNNNADTASHDAAVDILLPAGRFDVLANTLLSGQLGPYQLATSVSGSDIASCVPTFVRAGISVAETLPDSACKSPDDSLRVADHFRLVAVSGDTLTATALAAGFAAQLTLFANHQPVATATASAAGQPARVTYVVPANLYGAYVIEASAAGGGNTGGAYRLTVGRSGMMTTALLNATPARLLGVSVRSLTAR